MTDTRISKVILDGFADKLTAEDDAQLWESALAVLTEEFVQRYDSEARTRDRVMVVGACSHWVRPHQSRWNAAGGFAWQEGYRNSRPKLDRTSVLVYGGRRWVYMQKLPGKNLIELRVAIPARSARHKQVVIHTKWSTNQEPILFGFRKLENAWKCVAASDELANGRVTVPSNSQKLEN